MINSHSVKGGYNNSDDIQFLNTTFKCEICSQDLGPQTEQQRQAHYEDHFNEPQHANPTASSSKLPKRDAFWYPSTGQTPPNNFTPDLIPLLKKCLTVSHQKGFTTKAFLCHPKSVHIAPELWDRSWGCGYRNFLMACAALMEQEVQPAYAALINEPVAPGVRNLQLWIEDAWSRGYDDEGAKQLKNVLYETNKWIGTAEIYVAFTSRGIPSHLIDFRLEEKASENKLIDWVVKYFTPTADKNQQTVTDALRGAQAVTVTERMPIILQHQGHSRTIIGYEATKSGINLLLFDPSKTIKSAIKKAASFKTSASKSSYPSPTKLSSKIKRGVLHPLHGLKPRKRKASDPDPKPISSKRARSDPHEVIVIEDSDEEDTSAHAPVVDSNIDVTEVYKDVLAFSRVNAKSLGKKDKYQVLWFPLTPPLTEAEKRARKVVTSQRI